MSNQIPRVLIADVDCAFRREVAIALSESGVAVVFASTSDEIVSALVPGLTCAALEPTLPGTTWYHMVKRFAQAAAAARVPWTVVTAHPADALKDLSTHLGASAYIKKCVGPAVVARILATRQFCEVEQMLDDREHSLA